MIFKVELGICLSYGEWFTKSFKVEAPLEKDCEAKALDTFWQSLSLNDEPYNDAIVHVFVLNIKEEEDLDEI